MRNGLNLYFLVPVVCFVLILVALAIQVPYGQEFALFNAWRVSPFNEIGRFSTQFGEELVWVIAIIGLLFVNKRDALVLTLGGLALIPLVFGLKELYTIYRPSTFLQMHQLAASVAYVPEVELHTGRNSFPSGHTFSAFSLYFLLSQMMLHQPRLKVLGLLFAALSIVTGLSRVFLVQHFLVDVLAGITFGLLYAWLVLEVSDSMRTGAKK